MREIKFRAWDKDAREMLDLIALRDETGNVLMQRRTQPKTLYRNTPDRVEIMEYTGLHDKNGKEVYENDIIENHVHGFNLIVKWCDGKGKNLGSQVGWWLDDGYYMVELKAYQGVGDDHEYANVTVLGNIYEHPDLLKGVGSFGYDPITRKQRGGTER